MLALWREWEVDRILRQAWEMGIVLAGCSAGAICWFEQGQTASIPGKLSALDCLGFLPGSCAPHYDAEAKRRQSYQRLIAEGKLASGYGIDESVGLHFKGTELCRVVSARADAAAYKVERKADGVSETRLPVSVYVGHVEASPQEIVSSDRGRESQ